MATDQFVTVTIRLIAQLATLRNSWGTHIRGPSLTVFATYRVFCETLRRFALTLDVAALDPAPLPENWEEWDHVLSAATDFQPLYYCTCRGQTLETPAVFLHVLLNVATCRGGDACRLWVKLKTPEASRETV